jgi:Type II secretion system (T2SS), protein L
MIRVPRRSLISQEDIDLDEVRFQWRFISDIGVSLPVDQEMSGIGLITFMPQADQAIVFLSTLDVRLIPLKIPLVSDDKIRKIMPGLLEDHLLGDIEKFEFRILNPLEGDPALDRTVAVIDKQWLNLISSKVHELNAHRARLLPDCYLLSPIQSGQLTESTLTKASPNITYEVLNDQVIWTVRLGEQTGASWIDQINDFNQMNPLTDHDGLLAMLPTQLKGKAIAPFDWSSDWAINSVLHLAHLSDDDGINLLPDSYQAANPRKSVTQIKDQVFNYLSHWFTQWSWSRNKSMLVFAPLSFFAGYIVYGVAILLMNLGFNYQMNTLVGGYLNESSRTALQSNAWDFQQISKINHLLGQYHEQKRRAGELSQADFLMMSADLKKLIKIYGDGSINKIDYKSRFIEFEFTNNFLDSRKISPEKVVFDAAASDMFVISLGRDRFRLVPYAGLGYGL